MEVSYARPQPRSTIEQFPSQHPHRQFMPEPHLRSWRMMAPSPPYEYGRHSVATPPVRGLGFCFDAETRVCAITLDETGGTCRRMRVRMAGTFSKLSLGVQEPKPARSTQRMCSPASNFVAFISARHERKHSETYPTTVAPCSRAWPGHAPISGFPADCQRRGLYRTRNASARGSNSEPSQHQRFASNDLGGFMNARSAALSLSGFALTSSPT